MDSSSIVLELPWPPSWNHMYGQTKFGTRYMKAPGVQFKQDVKDMLAICYPEHKTITNPVSFNVQLLLPDRRTRDSSNILKILEDALTEAGAWKDDSLIHVHVIHKLGYVPHGAIYIEIEEIYNNLEEFWLEHDTTEEKQNNAFMGMLGDGYKKPLVGGPDYL